MAKITKAKKEEIMAKFPEFNKQLKNLQLTIDVMKSGFEDTLDKLDELEESMEDVEQRKIELKI